MARSVKKKNSALDWVGAFGRFVTNPAANIDPTLILRIRLLVAYFLLATLGTLGAALFFRTVDIRLFMIEIVACAILICCYAISRTRYYKITLPFTVIVPTIPSIVIVLLQPSGVNLLAVLMWLALPLLAAGLLLTLRQAHFIALLFIILAVSLALSGLVEYNSLAMLVFFFVAVVFFTISFSSLREDDVRLIKKQLVDLKQAEKTLVESEEKYRNLFELAKDAIILTDFESGSIIDANKTAEEMTGIPREKLIGKNHAELFPPESANDIVNRFIQHANEFKNRIYSDDVIMQRPDGSQVRANVSNSFFNLKGKQTTQSVYRDMTERYAMDKKLRDSEEMFSKAFQSSPAAISISSFDGGAFIAVNDSYTRDTGFTREELIGKNSEEFNMWVNFQEREKMIKAATEKRKLINEEMAFRNKSGKIRNTLVSTDFLEIAGQPCFIMTSLDVTDYKHTLKVLSETTAQLERVIHISPQQFLVTRAKDGAFLQVNESFTRATGYTREELAGQSVMSINLWVNPNDRVILLNELQKHGRVDNMEFEFRKKTGEILTELVSSELFELEGEPCLLTMFTDITERKCMEQALKASEEKFSRAFHTIPESLGITRIKDGTFVDVNNVFCRAVNKKYEEVIGHTSQELGLLDPPGNFERIIKTIQEQGPILNEEQKIGFGEENLGYTLFSADIVDIGGEPHLISIHNDISEKKRIENALRDSEEKLSKVFHAIPETISISRLKDGRIVDVNNSFCQKVGKTREQIIGHTREELNLLHPQFDMDYVIKNIQEHGPIRNLEETIGAGTANEGYALFSADILEIGGELHLVSIFNDITEKKKIENALRESEEKFSRTFHTIPDSLAITRVKDGTFVDVNDFFIKAVNLSREKVIGHTPAELGLPDPENRSQWISDTLHQNGSIRNFEILLSPDSPEPKYFLYSADYSDISGEPCIISIMKDITQLKYTEIALRESEEKFSKAFQAIPESISISSVSDGRFVDVNDTFCRSINRTREDIIGHTMEEMGLWQGEQSRDSLVQEINNKGSVSNREYSYIQPSGEVKTSLLSADIININGEPCMIVIANDISERKRIEQALQISEEKFSKAFQAIPEHIAITRVKDSVFVDVNDNFARYNGFAREQIIGHTGDEIGLKDRPAHPEALIKTIQEEGGIINREVVLHPNTDQMSANLFSARIIDIAGEPCMISVSTNITERKRMEEALANEALRRRILIEQSSDGIVVLDQAGNVHEANRRFAEMLGYTPEELLKMNIIDWEALESMEHIAEHLVQIDEKGESLITKHRRKDGSLYDVEISSNGVIYAGQKLIFSVCRDITERKRLEQVIKASEEKFSKAFYSIPEAISIIRAGDGVFLEVNDAFCQYANLTHDQIVGRHGDDLHLPDEGDTVAGLIQEVKHHGRVSNREIVYNPNTENMSTILFSADLIEVNGESCIITIAGDITAIKKIEMALRESEAKFSKIFRLSPQVIIISRLVADTVQEIIDVNESFMRQTGYTREDCLGKSMLDLGLWHEPEKRTKLVEEVLQTGHVNNYEAEFVMKSGEKRTWLFSTEKIEINGEECLIAIVTDITDRKHSEEQLKQAMIELKLSTAQLKATNKELESFSYSVSHDLRSPLRSIDGFSQALLEDYGPRLDETAQHYLNRMRNASQKMGELIDGLLKLSRLTRGEMHHETVDLSSLAEEICQRLQETDPERKVEFTIQKGLKANGDLQMLTALLENLLSNAWKFTQKVPLARIEFGYMIDRGKKTYFVKDNGAGFDMAFADKLFGAFQRLHNDSDFPGTGIGLATVQRIINRHGGNIRAEGSVDNGAVFYFTL